MTSFFFVLSYCHVSATLVSINVVNLQDNRAAISNFYRTFNVFT